MQQTIFGIILGVLLVLTMSVGFEIHEKYEQVNGNDYRASTSFTVDIDGIRYSK